MNSVLSQNVLKLLKIFYNDGFDQWGDGGGEGMIRVFFLLFFAAILMQSIVWSFYSLLLTNIQYFMGVL